MVLHIDTNIHFLIRLLKINYTLIFQKFYFFIYKNFITCHELPQRSKA